MTGDDYILDTRERKFREEADGALPTLALAGKVTQLMLEVAQAVTIDASVGDPPPEQLRRHALWFMNIIGLRAIRAAMTVLRTGYEDQSLGYQRLVDELHNRAQKVSADQSGSYADEWLKGRSLGKGAKMAGQEFWEFLSGPVHASTKAVFDWLAVPQDDGTAKVVIGPERRPVVANAALSYMASEGRDLAVLLAAEAGLPLDLRKLDAELKTAHDEYIPGDEASGGEAGST
jgi:hypothetical protein